MRKNERKWEKSIEEKEREVRMKEKGNSGWEREYLYLRDNMSILEIIVWEKVSDIMEIIIFLGR